MIALHHKRIRTIILLLTGALASTSLLYAASPVIIDESLDYRQIGRHIEYFDATGKDLSFKDILADKNRPSLPWIVSKADMPGFGFKEAVYWSRFTLKNMSDRDLEIYLHQEYPHIDRLTLYIPEGNGGYRSIHTGAVYPFAQRPFDYKNFIFPLVLKAGSEGTYYLRLDSHGSINIHLSVVTPEKFETLSDAEAIFFWIFYGAFLVMFIFNFFIFISTKEATYFYYTLYIISFGLFTMALGGMGYQYLWPENAAIGKMPIAVTMAIIIISIIQFAKSFVNIRSFSRVLHYLLTGVVVATIAVIAIGLVNRNYWFAITSTNILAGVAAVSGLSAVGYLYLNKRSRTRQSMFFLVSFSFFLFGVVMVVLLHRGILPSSVLTVNGIYVGAMFQVVTLSLGLADRINGMKNELGLLNAGLEEKVEDRTAELQAINEEMTVTNRSLMDARDALWSEMQLAKKIQTVLLPERPAMEGYEISAYMRPAEDVGGDYYDVINAGGMDWIVIGDVSGHGVPAGLVMMMAQTSINTVIAAEPGISPSEVLMKANRTLYRNIRKLRDDRYMTITVLAAHREGRFVFSGLHQDIMVHRHGAGAVELVDTNGMWIGIFDDLGGRVRDESFTLAAGDTMLLYTDGITEAWRKGTVKDYRDPGEAMFGEDRLQELFRSAGAGPVDGIRAAILAGLEDYDCADDVTMLIVRRTK